MNVLIDLGVIAAVIYLLRSGNSNKTGRRR